MISLQYWMLSQVKHNNFEQSCIHSLGSIRVLRRMFCNRLTNIRKKHCDLLLSVTTHRNEAEAPEVAELAGRSAYNSDPRQEPIYEVKLTEENIPSKTEKRQKKGKSPIEMYQLVLGCLICVEIMVTLTNAAPINQSTPNLANDYSDDNIDYKDNEPLRASPMEGVNTKDNVNINISESVPPSTINDNDDGEIDSLPHSSVEWNQGIKSIDGLESDPGSPTSMEGEDIDMLRRHFHGIDDQYNDDNETDDYEVDADYE